MERETTEDMGNCSGTGEGCTGAGDTVECVRIEGVCSVTEGENERHEKLYGDSYGLHRGRGYGRMHVRRGSLFGDRRRKNIR